MRAHARTLVLATLAFGLCRGGLSIAQGEPPVVVLDAVVSSPAGVVSPALTAEDFEVMSNRRPQRVVSASADQSSLAVVWLVDVSASVTQYWRISPLDIATALAGAMRPGDRARIGAVGATVHLTEWCTAESSELARSAEIALAVKGDEPFGPSPIWDATDAAIDAVAAAPGRHIVVLVTDGRATGNVHGLDELRAEAAARGVSVNVVAVAQASSWTGVNALMLQQLAATSGGLSIGLTKPTAPMLAALASRIMSDVRGAYRVVFVPDRPDGAVHDVSVRVKRPGFTVRTREQYVAGRVP
jgi:VWFA-related protein